MSYELRINGRVFGTYDSEQAAVERAREAVRAEPDLEPEILDTRTGRAVVPAGSKRWRDELANKIGY